jgi:hypothetical protein
MAYAAGSGAARRTAEEQAQSQQIADLQTQQDALAQQQALAAQQQAPQAAPAYAPQAAPAAGPDRIAQLKDLAALKEQGILTDEEFEREKQRILSGQ